MCYSGCEFENRSGGCKKPYDKICPMEIEEEKEQEFEEEQIEEEEVKKWK